MFTINYTKLRDNLKTCMDKITNDYEILVITRKDGRNVVMLSEESYSSLLENIHVMGNRTNYDWLMESKSQLENGNVNVLT